MYSSSEFSYEVAVQKQLASLPEPGCSGAEGTGGEVTSLLSVPAPPSGHQAFGEETVALCHHPQLSRAQLQSGPAVPEPSIIARADSRGVPLSLARSGKVAKRSREMCRGLTGHDFPNAPGAVTVLSSPNHMDRSWHSFQKSAFPNRGSRSVVPSAAEGTSPICMPNLHMQNSDPVALIPLQVRLCL